MKDYLLEKLKTAIDDTKDPNAQGICIELDYNEIVHLYALEKASKMYLEAMDDEMMNGFDKVEKL